MSPALQRVVAVALLLWLAAFTFAALDEPIGDGDEQVHATILRDMLRDGDWLRPHWDGKPVLERPLLPYWLAAPFSLALPGEAGIRIGSALASFATLLVVFAAARAQWQRCDAALLAALLLAGSPSFHAYSRTLMSDPLLVLGAAIAIAGTLAARRDPRALVIAGLGVGLAIAAKSLIAGVPALALAPWWIGPLRAASVRTRLWAGAALASLALPYYALMTALHGGRFLQAHFGLSLAQRATTSFGFGMQDGPASYLLWVPSGEGPLTSAWLLLGSAGALIAGLRLRRAELALLGGYALGVFVLMSLLATRLPHYILPAYPAAALGVAGLYVELTARTGFAQRAFAALLAPALGLCALLEARAHPGGYQYLLQRSTSRDLGLVAARVAAPGQTIYLYDWYGPAIAYYAERPLVMLTQSQHARGVLSNVMRTAFVPPPPEPPGSALLIVAEPDALAAASWLRVERVLASSPPALLARARVR